MYNGRRRKLNILSVKEKIINLTDETMYTYGTSGHVLRLESDIYVPGKLVRGYYYVVSDGQKAQILRENKEIEERYLLGSRYIGLGRDELPIYKFYSGDGSQVVPITEEVAVTNKIILAMKPRPVS